MYCATTTRASPHPSCGSWCKPICRHWKKPAALNSPRKKVGSTADIWTRWGSAARRSRIPAGRSKTFRTNSALEITIPMADIWARKSPAELLSEIAQGDGAGGRAHPLRRTLSALNLVTLGIGGIIGAGIFVLTGHAAAANAGPAVALSFMLGAVACAFAGLCYAEMASAVPISGSAYTSAYATLGELVAWIIGWDLILEYAVGATTVAIGWSGYVVSFARDFGLDLPARFVSAPLAYDSASRAWSATGAVVNLPAVAVIVAITSLLVVGIRETARFNNIIVAVKLTVIVLFIVLALPAFSTTNWVTPVNPDGRF